MKPEGPYGGVQGPLKDPGKWKLPEGLRMLSRPNLSLLMGHKNVIVDQNLGGGLRRPPLDPHGL